MSKRFRRNYIPPPVYIPAMESKSDKKRNKKPGPDYGFWGLVIVFILILFMAAEC